MVSPEAGAGRKRIAISAAVGDSPQFEAVSILLAAGRTRVLPHTVQPDSSMRSLIKTFLMLAVASPLVAQGAQQAASNAPAPVAIPAAGEAAPDFTLPWTNGKGMKEDFTLSKHRGEVVVLAFYPADFSRGCTIQMSKYRDDYKAIFGEGVTLVPISRDSIPM